MRIPQDLPKPLQGTYLIEASAGTGKTETLSDIVVYLVAVGGRPISEILVVTFTEAATEELKGRLLKRLQQAAEVLDNPAHGDERLAYLANGPAPEGEIRTRIEAALKCFDEAAVFTIHGFCHKILKEHAFESGFLFDLELSGDQRTIVQEIVDDFWRMQTASLPELLVRHLHAKTANLPDGLAGFAVRVLRQAQLDILLPEPLPDIDILEKQALSRRDHLREIWRREKSRLADLLLMDTGLNRRNYPVARIPGWLEESEAFLESGNLLKDWSWREKFCSENIVRACKKGCRPLHHPFFEGCSALCRDLQALYEGLDCRLLKFKWDLVQFVRCELGLRKTRLKIRSFDDLLTDFRAALQEGDGYLARLVRSKFPVALVDEFQDTDPVQYEIFRTLFPGRDSLLFLIGDPKQAIYSFRGADIFTYMGAGRHALRIRLDRNWRSAPKLVNAVNTLFAPHRNPFVFKDIGFEALSAGRPDLDAALLEDGQPSTGPLRIWFFPRREESAGIDRKSADSLLPGAVADEILSLLEKAQKGRVTLEGRPLQAGDMAVIVRRNQEAVLVRDALRQKGIAAVIHSNESLFASLEAESLLRLLEAVAEPGSERLVRAALASSLFGLDWNGLYQLFADEEAWESMLERFHDWRSLWQERGFMAMAGDLLRREKIRSRLLGRPDGERQLTNLMHCLELLHHTAARKHLGVTGLVKWFAGQVEERPDQDEYQLRLETDRKAVTVITIHRSKGLGFPIVFCPYSWEGLGGGDGVFFHDPEHGNRYCLDLGSDRLEKHKKMMEKESLGEHMRLLYVALTRAKHRCYLAWGAFKGARSSALAYLVHGRPGNDNDFPEGVFPNLPERSDAELLADIERRVQLSGGDISVTGPPEPSVGKLAAGGEAVFPGEVAELGATLDRGWEISSFTSLASGAGPVDERREKIEEVAGADRGLEASLPTPPAVDNDFIHFPRGARAGLCLHAILEKMDFGLRDKSGLAELARDQLGRYGFDAGRWSPVIAGMLAKLCSAPLKSDHSSFCLADIGAEKRLTEMEFHFPMAGLSAESLRPFFSAWGSLDTGAAPLRPLHERRLEGFLKGFIDLVFEYEGRFFVVDWKSNYLGDRPEHYNQGRLREAMDREGYHLQYHLYCLALHKYLRTRIPGYHYERHFGAVFYAFLRGVDPVVDPENGIYAIRPGIAAIENLERLFQGK